MNEQAVLIERVHFFDETISCLTTIPPIENSWFRGDWYGREGELVVVRRLVEQELTPDRGWWIYWEEVTD